MSGATKRYTCGNKQHWRRTVWNRISALVRRDWRSSAIVLYLAGAEDRDRAIAKQRGFVDWNLIAIERHSATINRLRDARSLTVDGDVVSTLLSWPRDKRVHVLHLDLCCGFDKKTVDGLFRALARPPFMGAVVAVNMMRGRDANSRDQREWVADIVARLPKYDQSSLNDKHRGVTWWYVMAGPWIDLAQHDGEVAALLLQVRAMACFLSYRSDTRQTFDTIVFPNLLLPAELWLGERMAARGATSAADFMVLDDDDGADLSQRRRIAATLAHRTRRIPERRRER